jgi:hypothetical protein
MFLMKYFIFSQILLRHQVHMVETKILRDLFCKKDCGMTFSSPFASVTPTVIFI